MLTNALLLSILSGVPLPDGIRVVDPAALVESADRAALDLLTGTARDTLHTLGVDGLVTSRVKSAESLVAKMARKGVALDDVHDRLAVRILVADVDDCYRVLDALHGQFSLVDGELDDYIQHPKASGYQSLHTAVRLRSGQTAEFQIRTHDMHAFAETGPAAHWRYKAGLFEA